MNDTMSICTCAEMLISELKEEEEGEEVFVSVGRRESVTGVVMLNGSTWAGFRNTIGSPIEGGE